MVLLAGAMLMTKSLMNLEKQNFGVAITDRYVVHLDPEGAAYTPERLPALYRQIEDRFSTLPGVRNVGLSLYSPLEGDNWGDCVIQQGHPTPGPTDKCNATSNRVKHAFSRCHRPTHTARPGVRRPGHRNFATGCHREPDVCQAVLPSRGSAGQTL